MGVVTCISGIDTDIGKSVATGLMARSLSSSGYSVITQKLVQTGCHGVAEDIQRHRQLMGIDLLPEDLNGLTCPYVFSKPCSPHLAAELEGTAVDPERIRKATERL
ncbi:MAG: dethiobiotin synthase, partial [Proteobacteria bacterium]|nr:dethiobiotin synthase [Pseudomonadota bacterium]